MSHNRERIGGITIFDKVVLGAVLVMSFACAEAPAADDWASRAKAAFPMPIEEEAGQEIFDSLPLQPTVAPRAARRLLVFSRCEGFIHSSIPYYQFMIRAMGLKTGAFTAEFIDDYDVFSADNLASFDAVLLNNTTHLKLNLEQQQALLNFVQGGKGIIGIHAATDNFAQWKEGACMMGGLFRGHPWTAGGTWAFRLDDVRHPLNAAFANEGFWHRDEIYQYHPESFQGSGKLRLLVSLDMTKLVNQRAPVDFENQKRKRQKSGPVPLLSAVEERSLIEEAINEPTVVSWIRAWGEGRLFYTNFGHRPETSWHPQINQHILDGIQYAMGDLTVDDRPTAEVPDLVIVAAPEK